MHGGNLAYLGELEPADVDQAVGLYHASPRDPVWEYVLSLAAGRAVPRRPAPAGLPDRPLPRGAVLRPRRRAAATTGETAAPAPSSTSSSGEWLLNPGSVGQPRDGDPRAAWLMLDTDAWAARWRRVEYDIGGGSGGDPGGRLPDSLAERLQYGQ